MEHFQFVPNNQIERARRRTQALIHGSQRIATIAALQITTGLAEIELATIPTHCPEQLTPEQIARSNGLSEQLCS
jgi:hypothetical protein